MVTRLPGMRVGLAVNIDVTEPPNEPETLRSRVEDLRDDQIIIIWPTKRGQLMPFPIGGILSLNIPTLDADGRVSATLYLDCEVIQRFPPTRDEPIATLALRVVAVGRQQQRKNFRLAISMELIDCAFWDRPFGMPENMGRWEPINASIIDIGGGGVGLNADADVPEGTRLRVRFAYPLGVGEFASDALVRGTNPLGTGRRHRLAVAFTGVAPERRERLTRCIHRFQLEQARRDKAIRRGG
ncbi:MAG: PilZ domain-containing protein [Chloroflexi bacterium]|nr:PilZ domain-containing protein [Chloroflexota bacterium]